MYGIRKYAPGRCVRRKACSHFLRTSPPTPIKGFSRYWLTRCAAAELACRLQRSLARASRKSITVTEEQTKPNNIISDSRLLYTNTYLVYSSLYCILTTDCCHARHLVRTSTTTTFLYVSTACCVLCLACTYHVSVEAYTVFASFGGYAGHTAKWVYRDTQSVQYFESLRNGLPCT